MSLSPASRTTATLPPQRLRIAGEPTDLLGERQLAADPARQPELLGELAHLVQVVQAILGPRWAVGIPPEPVRVQLDELPVEVAGLGEGDR